MNSTNHYLIVDGYNVLRSGNRYMFNNMQDWTDDYFNTLREKLINDIFLFCSGDIIPILIFDGKNNKYSKGIPSTIGNMKVIFSRQGIDADQVIVNTALKYRKEHNRVTVVTSDSSIQSSVMGEGVVRMSANDFCNEISLIESTNNLEDDVILKKNTIKGLIDNDILAKLLEIRDKKSDI